MQTTAVVDGGEQIFEIVGGAIRNNKCVLSLRSLVDGRRMISTGRNLDEAMSAPPTEEDEGRSEPDSLGGVAVKVLKMSTWQRYGKQR